MPVKLPLLTVIKDTREQKGWHFEPEEKKPGKPQIIGTKVGTLDAGDYSLEGFENVLRIERKNGFCELFGNMSPKDHKERFHREMEKLSVFPFKYILVETSLNNDTLGLSIPQMYNACPASAVTKWLLEIEYQYGVKVWFVGDRGKRIAKQIFELVVRQVKNGTS